MDASPVPTWITPCRRAIAVRTYLRFTPQPPQELQPEKMFSNNLNMYELQIMIIRKEKRHRDYKIKNVHKWLTGCFRTQLDT